MSSEMRELIAKWRAVAEKQRGMASRDNERGDLEYAARMAGMAERTEYMADELEALLARTEAGADGAWGTVVESRMLNENGLCALAVRTERGELKMGDKLYTHPHDASEDAELIEAVGTYEEAVRLFGRTSPSASRAYCRMTDVLAAMQAKEAPNRSAMMRDDEMRGSECEKACDYWLRFKEQDGGMSPWYRCSLEQYARARRQHDSDTCVTKKGETP